MTILTTSYPGSIVPVPRLSLDQQHTVRRLIQVATTPQLEQISEFDREGLANLPSMMDQLSRMNLVELKKALAAEGAGIPWWTCEWARRQFRTKGKNGDLRSSGSDAGLWTSKFTFEGSNESP